MIKPTSSQVQAFSSIVAIVLSTIALGHSCSANRTARRATDFTEQGLKGEQPFLDARLTFHTTQTIRDPSTGEVVILNAEEYSLTNTGKSPCFVESLSDSGSRSLVERIDKELKVETDHVGFYVWVVEGRFVERFDNAVHALTSYRPTREYPLHLGFPLQQGVPKYITVLYRIDSKDNSGREVHRIITHPVFHSSGGTREFDLETEF
jgi:hypothetical protein